MATKSKALASGPMRPTTGIWRFSFRYSRSDASVSIDMAKTPGATSRSAKAVGLGLEEGGQVALGVDLAGQDPLAALGGQLGEGGGDRGLADPALAGDEDQLEVEQARRPVGGGGTAGHFRRAAQGAPKPTRRSSAGAPTST